MAKRKLKDAVVVITGATSGIGRATARRFARKGARLVLAGRREDQLAIVESECEGMGGRAAAVVADVTDEFAVRDVADRALAEFGRIDVWINDAGVYMMGELTEVPAEAHKRVIDVNVNGVIYGSKVALRQFRQQGSGVLINVASAAGLSPYALAATYSASKAAVRALTLALRQENRSHGIDVCMISPASVDTPLFAHAANYTGQALKPMKPIYTPERIARAIVRCAEHPRREVRPGAMPKMMRFGRLFLKPLIERVQPVLVKKDHLQQLPAPHTLGNLFTPIGPGGVDGGWKRMRPAAWLGLMAAASGLAALALRNRRVLRLAD